MKDHKEHIAAITARGEQIKTNSAEFLWICCGIRPPPLRDKPVVADPSVDPEHLQLQLRPLDGGAPTTGQRP
jgi:hypothetical protein